MCQLLPALNLKTFYHGNPEKYNALLKEIVPAAEFPNVNSKMLEKAEPPKSIVFINSSSLRKLVEKREDDSLKKHDEFLPVYRKYATAEVSVR